VTAWLGIAILLAFSLGLNLFMRLEVKPRAAIPDHLRSWTRLPTEGLAEGLYVERRVVELQRRGLNGPRWVEQRRVRRLSDDAIVEVLEERVHPRRRNATVSGD
jgi:hypothetical protein